MNIENELKLIPKNGISKNKVIGLLRELGIDVPEQGKVIHQEDTYFDDKNGTLEKSGGSFRIRRKGNKTQITCKIPVESNTEYKQRKEYEINVPKEYEQNLDMELAIKLLKQQYPELVFPENMREVVTVINDRNKFDLTCQDGTVLEMAFDSLKGKDGSGRVYSIRPEIEFETLSGNPDNLISVYETILKEFPGQVQRNVLSKYARTKKEIEDKKLTLEELSACAWFSQILSSTQFDKLKYKGQILHRYDKPTLPQLDNFKDFSYLVDRISEIKSGEYKIPVPRNIAEKEGKKHLIESENYEVTDDIDLEDMFCILLSDAHYEIADEILADFLDKNYYQDDKAMTNRLSHSQQVMLATGLICKSSQVGANLYERLTAMMSALSHDIGHVPYSHLMEQELQDKIGGFSHDNNGAEVIGKIYDTDNETMYNNIQNYYQGKYGGTQNNYEVREAIRKQKNIVQTAIREHSRTNSEQRGEGIIVQGPREADKIQYVCSDIRDLQKFFRDKGIQQADFFSEEFVENALEQICKKKPYEYDEVKQKIYSLFINPIKKEKYGIAAVNIINTVKYSKYDNKEYYDVDQDIWKFIEHTIARTKDIRKEKGIDDTRATIKSFSRYITARKLVGEYLEPNEGDRKKAREDGLQDITNMGELDGLSYANDDILGLSKEDINRLKSGDYTQLSQMQLNAIRKRTYELLSRVFVQTGHGTEEELRQLAEEVENYDVKELVETYLGAPVITRMDEQNLEQFKVEDVQLKIKPSSDLTATSILRIIGNGNEQYENFSFDDFYFESNLPDKKLSLRTFRGKAGLQGKMLRVKEKLEKKVSEIIRNTYEVKGGNDESPEELLRKLNEKYPGLNIEFAERTPYKHVSIQRLQWTFMSENGQKIELREDTGTSNDKKEPGKKKQIHQIEIHADAKTISKIKKKLMKHFGRGIFTQETKEGGEVLEQDGGNSGGVEK